MKEKNIYKLFAFVLFTSAIIVGVNINLNEDNLILSDIAIRNLEILAQNEGGGSGCTVHNCPGGCCNYNNIWGDNCNSCCPEGKDPTCNSSGCNCR